MIRYILKRLLWLIPVLLGVSILIFTILYFTPGDPMNTILGPNPTPEQIEITRAKLHLDQPYLVQLGIFLKDLIQFDLGESYANKASVSQEILHRLPNTATIAGVVALMQLAIAIPLGVTAAVHQNKWQDRFCILLSMVGTSIPGFWFAMLMILLFSLKLGWLPSYGVGHWYNFIMPCLAIALMGIGGMARQTRSQMLEVIRSDYIITARAKGVPERDILYRHALPNALIPVVTQVGTQFGKAMGGSIVIESVFSIPGIGYYLVTGIGNRDYAAIRGTVVVFALLFSLCILLIDLVYAFIDPRIKAQYENQHKRRMKKVAEQ